MLDKIDRKLWPYYSRIAPSLCRHWLKPLTDNYPLLEASETAGGRRYSYGKVALLDPEKIGLGLTAFVL